MVTASISLSGNFEKNFFKNTSFISLIWETAYFMYELQNFNQQLKNFFFFHTVKISQVLFKHFIQERKTTIQDVHALRSRETSLSNNVLVETETLAQVFSCKFCKTSKITFLDRKTFVVASE